MRRAIICFTRAPIPGQTKTRLMPRLTGEQCAGLHRAFLRDLSRTFAQVDADLYIAYTPEGGEAALREIFPAARTLFRPDGSTCHTCYMDPATGAPVRAMTAQGYKADSAWARGQAWGILGMALAYRFTGEADYLERFQACARFFLQRLPADGVPYWDLVFTEGDEPRDSSAAAIAACGIYEALPHLTAGERAELGEAADRLLLALVRHCAADAPRPGGGVLRHGVYCKSSPYNTVQDYGIDEANLWGDYFYMEALTRRTRRWQPYWA